MTRNQLLFFLLMSSIMSRAHAQAILQYSPQEISACISKSSAKYHIHPHVVYAIAKLESDFNPGALSKENKDGSKDHGIMQINDWWLKNVLWKYGIKKADLYNPCYNIEIGTWILAQCVQKHGETWRAVGCYNANSVDKQNAYIKNVIATFKKARKTAGVE